MDEVGSDLNMLNDGFIGGKKFLSRKGDTAKICATKKSRRFTVLGVTNLAGDPVMCVIIYEGKERNVFVESGIDPMHPLYNHFDDCSVDEDNNFEFFENNYGKGRLFPGGHVCEIEGKKIPTMIRYSEKGSITPEILKDILKTIDDLEVFQTYRDNGAVPFLLVDGHQSRFHSTFLEYITDDAHPWKVSIGVPYGTSLWQVGDSPQQNGRFKIAMSEAKKMFIQKRIETFCSELELIPTDIIPMLNFAWEVSFADKSGNQDAIRERGFNPLNKNLLLLDILRRTMTSSDKEEEEALQLLTEQKLSMLGHGHEYNNDHPLNFNCGYASTAIDKLVGAVDLQRARARNHAKAKFGTNSKALIKKMKKLSSAGQLVRVAHTHEIGMDLLIEIKLRKSETDKALNEKLKKKQQHRFDCIDRYVSMKEGKKDETKWNNGDIKIAIKALKEDKDGKMPTKKNEMMEMWNMIKHREADILEEHKALLCEIAAEENMV